MQELSEKKLQKTQLQKSKIVCMTGQIIFCVDRFSQSSTMEQLDLKTVKAVIDNMKKI